jgi:hypothetical protein
MTSPEVPATLPEPVPVPDFDPQPPATRPEDAPRRYAGYVLFGLWLTAAGVFFAVRTSDEALARVVKAPFQDGVATATFACGGGPHGLYLVFDESRPPSDDAARVIDLAPGVRDAAQFSAPDREGGVRRGSLADVEAAFFAFARDPSSTAWREAAAWNYVGSVDLPRRDVVVTLALPPTGQIARDGAIRPVAMWLEPLHGRSGLRAVLHDLAGFVWLTAFGAAAGLVYVLVIIPLRRRRGKA